MKHSEIIEIPIRYLINHPKNPRRITNESLNRLCDSIRQNGYWAHRPMAVEPVPDREGYYYILDGNQRKKALGRLKRKTGPCMIYTELTDEERDEIILRGNINNGEWDTNLLQIEFAPRVDFDSIGLQFEVPSITPASEPEPPVAPTSAPPENKGGDNDDDWDEMYQDKLEFYHRMMGDFLYPTNNQFEIPTLLLDNQPVHLELPLNPWGVEGRYKKGINTYHFYVDDYRFERLYKDPVALLLSGCKAVVEPNNSIHDQTPVAYAIYQIYRKRYLTRYLQECGVQVWVDLNVSHRFIEYNSLGIPEGYNAFFTRGVAGWEPTLELHLKEAQRISGRKEPNMYVYGGGKQIEQWAIDHGLRYIDEHMNHRMKEKGLKK